MPEPTRSQRMIAAVMCAAWGPICSLVFFCFGVGRLYVICAGECLSWGERRVMPWKYAIPPRFWIGGTNG